MGLLADHHPDLRRPVQAARLHVPTGPGQHRVARGGQPDRVAQPRAGGKPDAGIGWESQKVEYPPAGHQLRGGCSR